ncbi:MAG TPA: hypothetical protein VMZ22_00675 [Acidimicrobiales bacterium]|nr:hypothetical protein [Acidimicrobiales bacterium]
MIGVVRIPLRCSGAALLVTGLGLALSAPHPSVLGDRVTADVVLSTGEWRFIHYALLVACSAGILGVLGMVAVHGDRLGRAGQLALFATMLGFFATGAVMLIEAVMFPDVARAAPQVIQFDGQIFGQFWMRVAGGVAALFPFGLAALGLLAYRVGPYRNAGAALVAGVAAFMALGFFFVPVGGPVSNVAFGAVVAWWGAIVWRAAPTTSGPDAPDRR